MLMRIGAIHAPMVMIVAAGFFYGRNPKRNMAFANQLTLEMFIPAPVLRRWPTAASRSAAVGSRTTGFPLRTAPCFRSSAAPVFPGG
jgi:hypothetical protein